MLLTRFINPTNIYFMFDMRSGSHQGRGTYGRVSTSNFQLLVKFYNFEISQIQKQMVNWDPNLLNKIEKSFGFEIRFSEKVKKGSGSVLRKKEDSGYDSQKK